MTITFLFLAYFGSFGRLFMVSRSVCVRITLFSNTGSTNGSISFAVPHLADPYSTPPIFLRSYCDNIDSRFKGATPKIPMQISWIFKLDSGF